MREQRLILWIPDAAKYFLEDCIDNDIILASQVCGDLSLFNMQTRAVLCLAYAGMASDFLSHFVDSLSQGWYHTHVDHSLCHPSRTLTTIT